MALSNCNNQRIMSPAQCNPMQSHCCCQQVAVVYTNIVWGSVAPCITPLIAVNACVPE